MADGARPRVISVLPSATEVLCRIGGQELLVGRSHEDNYPAAITHLPVLTGQKTTFTTAKDVDAQVSAALSSGQSLYTLDAEKIRELQPDVILTQDLCEVCAIDLPTVERLAASMSPQPKVVSLNPQNLEDVLDTMLAVGEAVGLKAEAKKARAEAEARLARVDKAVAEVTEQPGWTPPNVLFVEWPDPIYVGGHWTPQMIQRAGGLHPLNPATAEKGGGAGKSYAVTHETAAASAPELVIIAPCGLTVEMTRPEVKGLQATSWWASLPAVQKGRVALVDGDAMFNRPGPRLVDCLEWLAATMLGRRDLEPDEPFPFEWLKES
jgi:ABC-type Fe3+-hydroxamate transport system substrate-binding protein